VTSATLFQALWSAQLELLENAKKRLDEREWAEFVALLTFRVAAETARFLELEELPE
jgi:hypothetical protein